MCSSIVVRRYGKLITVTHDKPTKYDATYGAGRRRRELLKAYA
ncbi:hypothetical protein SBF1_2860006 [Candidatus Desulfosporosinus infrequens]|uniref:Uncharacterized protein n=1 Tax=Candidatus Desulfosporosinus infrequens TaxID=2043169 RepID=A0A2U3KUV3_9FIRM|nr:hypothetical protein SBF1_2860006 [Candidatus Desulfosporosinus infrequens]